MDDELVDESLPVRTPFYLLFYSLLSRFWAQKNGQSRRVINLQQLLAFFFGLGVLLLIWAKRA
jgi:hypothetical protein